ncbi:SRPBCC family protein [Micrococcaceae bacterium Sec5.7]
MPIIEESVFISRKPEDVFDYVNKAENLPAWDSSIVRAGQIGSDPVKLGTRARGTSKILGRNFDWTTEVTEFESPHRLAYKSVEGKLGFTLTNTFESADGGTRFTYHVDAASGLGGIFGRLGDPLVQKAQARTVRANLETLTEILTEHPRD